MIMGDKYIPIDEVTFVEKGFLWGEGEESRPRFKIKVPHFMAGWDGYQAWEKERFDSMEANLKQGDVLFDIGSETGWMSVIYGKIVGPENVCLFEPVNENWPNILATWEENFGNVKPLRACACLVSDKTTAIESSDGRLINFARHPEFDKGIWPARAYGDHMLDARKYQYVHEHAHETPQISIDDFVYQSGIVPRGITIDVEGAEYLVLKGAQKTLGHIRPLVWVSVHEDQMKRNYDNTPEQISAWMHGLGYSQEKLAEDHEVHMFYRPLP